MTDLLPEEPTLDIPRTRREFAAKAYRFDWSHDKLVLPCACDFPSCPGWRSEYESSVDETQYAAEVLAEARAFRAQFLAALEATSC